MPTLKVGLRLVKDLEFIAHDVRVGDLVRVYLSNGEDDYVGYRWNISRGLIVAETQLLNLKEADMIFAGLNPNGVSTRRFASQKSNDSTYLLDNIQFVGLNISKKKLGKLDVMGYEILMRNAR